jgi:hypothetical protein
MKASSSSSPAKGNTKAKQRMPKATALLLQLSA